MCSRFTFATLLLLSLVGCAAQRPVAVTGVDESTRPAAALATDERVALDEPVAVALAFDPPITIGELALPLSRESRERSAFVGFEEQTITSFYIRIDDRDFGRHRDGYDRRAIIERVGTTYR